MVKENIVQNFPFIIMRVGNRLSSKMYLVPNSNELVSC